MGLGPRVIDWLLFLATEMKRRTTACGGSLLQARAAVRSFMTVGRGEDEGAHYRGAVACSLCDDSHSSRFGLAV